MAHGPRAADHPGRGVGAHRGGTGAAGHRPRPVPRRPVHRKPVGDQGRDRATVADRFRRRVRPRRPWDPGARRLALCGLGDRHRPGRRRGVPGARGQPSGPQWGLLRPREPGGDDQGAPRRLRQSPHPPCRPLRGFALALAAGDRTAHGHGPHRGRAHPRCRQLRLFRACLPGPPDGSGVGRRP